MNNRVSHLLFVCHGNICRSPMAEFVMKDLVAKAGQAGDFHIESAATSTEEIGNPVYPPARRKLAEHGIRSDGKTARQMTRSDYDCYDLLIGMDEWNIRNMLRISGGDPRGKIHKLLDFLDPAAPRHGADVADPWYTGDFEATWNDVLDGCSALLKTIHPAKQPDDSNGEAPIDLVFVDALILAYRLGNVSNDEQKTSVLQASRTATDAMSFMNQLEELGISPRTSLHRFIGKYLAAPAYYRSTYEQMFYLRDGNGQPQSLLDNYAVPGLVEPLLTASQQRVFYDAYWWFVHNHQPSFVDNKRAHRIGTFATDPKDNASTLERFNKYLLFLKNHKNKTVRALYEGFPLNEVMAVLKRAFQSNLN